MVFGKKAAAPEQQITAPDLLMVMSDNVQKAGEVHAGYARLFQQMITDAYGMGMTTDSTSVIAASQRSLNEAERAALMIIGTSLGYARHTGDDQLFLDTVKQGVEMMARFPDYIAAIHASAGGS